ncbi:hypothetical protein COCSADRAFT_171682 [Bipolaris sorokiniana ND90Pr]|uniref:Uncharacterized protein n=1 Tax=Cochliobolus sativus (strain ND90Pr / ATCC 201652) TaxID=665912 RepID=M2T2Z3_COCSN|nr:uncharacterized protein COCSADRAFT_171682 [Bipolaris sorokiniana ND90Pr]EMD63412.1 hypothetical protein COCSADRAFT_171682 [Bipolaris sorokiniana ND90Pr]
MRPVRQPRNLYVVSDTGVTRPVATPLLKPCLGRRLPMTWQPGAKNPWPQVPAAAEGVEWLDCFLLVHSSSITGQALEPRVGPTNTTDHPGPTYSRRVHQEPPVSTSQEGRRNDGNFGTQVPGHGWAARLAAVCG